MEKLELVKESVEKNEGRLKRSLEDYYSMYYNLIIDYLVENGIRKQDFAKEVGVSNTACSLFLKKLKNGQTVSSKTLSKYIKVINNK